MSYALVQKNNVTSGTGATSIGLAYTNPPTAGNLIVAMALLFTEPETVTISDTLTDSFTSLGAYQDADFSASIACSAAICKSTAADTVTFSWGTSTGYSLFVAEFSGAGATVVEDGTMQTVEQNTSVTSVTTPSFTPTASGSLLINMIGAGGNLTAPTGSVWTLGASDANDNGWLYTVAPSTTAVAPNATITPGSPYLSAVVGVKAPVGGVVIPIPSLVISQAVNRAAIF